MFWSAPTGNTLFHGSTYAEADAFLAKGLKLRHYHRRISSIAHLVRQDDWAISLVLHSTPIITYCDDGTYVLDHGGWQTPTTRNYISSHSPFHRLWSTYDRKNPGWILGYTGKKTPKRIQKCRSCNGRGGDVYCGRCVAWGWHGRDSYCRPWGRRLCEHGKRGTHYVGPKLCNQHQRSEWTSIKCYRCDGKGVRDYGSQPIPIVWKRTDGPVRLAADGTVLQTTPREYPALWYPTSMNVIKETVDIHDLVRAS